MAGGLPDKGAKIQAQLQALEQALQNTHISNSTKATEYRSLAPSTDIQSRIVAEPPQPIRTITIQVSS